jgi:hypothetical protein
MTLVVARRSTEGKIRVIADMRLRDHWNIKRGYPHAVLKNIILDRELLVAYAGNVDLAVDAIRGHRHQRGDTLLTGLLGAAEHGGEGKNGVEFLVADVGRGLFRIRHTGVEPAINATWIGDLFAFEFYQQIYHGMPKPQVLTLETENGPPPEPYPDTPDTEAFLRMSGAIGQIEFVRAIPGAPSIPALDSVGEAFVSAFSSPDGFHYEQQATISTSHEQVIESPEWTTLDGGSAANGGFGYTQLSPSQPGIGLVGLYFPHARLGLIYHPLVYDGPAFYRDISHDEFVRAVEEDHAVAIDGPRFG